MTTVLALDAGTTGVTALVVSEAGRALGRGYSEFDQHFPRPGWVEHEPEEIWVAVLQATAAALDAAGQVARNGLAAIGITNQRETAVLWHREELTAPRPAIVWQDRRSESVCQRLRAAGAEPRIAELTGLRLDPYFTGTSLTWLAEQEPQLWRLVRDGSVAVGTVDSYVLARLTGGRQHVTDHSNASRTLLYDLAAGDWSRS
ncbi:MAG: FGGY family carbohydrate kinase, partial [Mycobacteriales bacterium]